LDGTYSNGHGGACPLTMADIVAAAAAVEPRGPPPPADITVAPDIVAALLDFAPPSAVRRVSAALPMPFGRLDAVRVHLDDRLSAGHWHPGLPRRLF
jgi:hypothetical protein